MTRIYAPCRFRIAILSAFVIVAAVGACNQLVAADQERPPVLSQPIETNAAQLAESLSTTFRRAAQSLRPAVIGIHSCKPGPLPAVSWDPVILDFLRNDTLVSLAYPLAGDPSGPAVVEESLGSGIIVSADGIAVTSLAAVDGAKRVRVRTSDGDEHSAKVIRSDAASGVALLKIEGSNFPFAPLAISTAQVGDWVAAVGALPNGENSLSLGVISAQSQAPANSNDSRGLIMTDVTIDVHNNGGALVNLKGEVVGINTLKSSSQNGIRTFGFAMPIERIRGIIDSAKGLGDRSKGQDSSTASAVHSQSVTKIELPAAWQDLAVRVRTAVTATAQRLGIREWSQLTPKGLVPNKSETVDPQGLKRDQIN